MTVATSTAKSGPYAGAGTTGPFTVAFPFVEATHLRVTRTSTSGVNTTLTYTTDYSVAGAGGASGTVTLVTALAIGEQLTITRNVPFTQTADYVSGDPFPAESHERQLDLACMRDQQTLEVIGRTLTLPVNSPAGISTVLPAPVADEMIGWDSAGTGLRNVNPTTLASVVAFAAWQAQTFSGDGVTTAFVLSGDPGNIANMDVSIGGDTKRPTLDYTLSGSTVTFLAAPAVGTDNILMRYGQALPQSTSALELDLANTSDTAKGDALIGVKKTATGAVATTLHNKIEGLYLDAGTDFGCDTTGATNTTTAMKAFFDACIASGRPGFIPAGTYLITAGVLAFDTPFVDATWPDIRTAGHQAVTFKRADATNSPMISLTNGTASSGAGRYWRGGSLGGITFDQNGKATASGQHGINLRGVWGTEFGWMRCNDQGGSAVHIEPLLFGGTNPDPYAVTFCTFEGIEANRCKLWALQNENYVGFNFCKIEALRAIECEAGGWFGLGSGNEVAFVSMGTIKGIAFDDGTHSAATGGAPNKTLIHLAELDDVQNGFRLNRASNMRVLTARFVHRYNFSSLNPSEGYWPRKAIQLAAGASPSVIGVDMDVLHRIEAGGVKANLGAFTDLSSNANILNFSLNHRVIDNAGFGILDSDLFTGLNVNGTVRITRDGTRIADRMIRPYVRALATGATVVPNSGYTVTKIQFPTEESDRNALYNAADTFTVPFTGSYRVKAQVCLTMAAGSRVRLSIMKNASVAANMNAFAATAAVQHYTLSDVIECTQGDTLWVSADQNTGTASLAVSAPINVGIDNHFIVEAV